MLLMLILMVPKHVQVMVLPDFFITGKLIRIKAARSFTRNPHSWLLVFQQFFLINQKLYGQLVSSVALPITFDDSLSVTFSLLQLILLYNLKINLSQFKILSQFCVKNLEQFTCFFNNKNHYFFSCLIYNQYKIFESNSSFHLKQRTTRKV